MITMKKVSESIDVKFLDYAPEFKGFGPDSVVAATGILTMKDMDIEVMLEKIDEKLSIKKLRGVGMLH